MGPSSNLLSTYLKKLKPDFNVSSKVLLERCSAITTGNPEGIGGIWLPVQVPSSCFRQLLATMKMPGSKDIRTVVVTFL